MKSFVTLLLVYLFTGLNAAQAMQSIDDQKTLIPTPKVEECRIAHTGKPFCTEIATDC